MLTLSYGLPIQIQSPCNLGQRSPLLLTQPSNLRPSLLIHHADLPRVMTLRWHDGRLSRLVKRHSPSPLMRGWGEFNDHSWDYGMTADTTFLMIHLSSPQERCQTILHCAHWVTTVSSWGFREQERWSGGSPVPLLQEQRIRTSVIQAILSWGVCELEE